MVGRFPVPEWPGWVLWFVGIGQRVMPNLVMSALMDITRELGVAGTFLIDCDSYPCVATFDGHDLPSMEDRAVIANKLIQALPTQASVVNHTQFGEQGRVAWGLFVGEGELTDSELDGAEDRLMLPKEDGAATEELD